MNTILENHQQNYVFKVLALLKSDKAKNLFKLVENKRWKNFNLKEKRLFVEKLDYIVSKELNLPTSHIVFEEEDFSYYTDFENLIGIGNYKSIENFPSLLLLYFHEKRHAFQHQTYIGKIKEKKLLNDEYIKTLKANYYETSHKSNFYSIATKGSKKFNMITTILYTMQPLEIDAEATSLVIVDGLIEHYKLYNISSLDNYYKNGAIRCMDYFQNPYFFDFKNELAKFIVANHAKNKRALIQIKNIRKMLSNEEITKLSTKALHSLLNENILMFLKQEERKTLFKEINRKEGINLDYKEFENSPENLPLNLYNNYVNTYSKNEKTRKNANKLANKKLKDIFILSRDSFGSNIFDIKWPYNEKYTEKKLSENLPSFNKFGEEFIKNIKINDDMMKEVNKSLLKKERKL